MKTILNNEKCEINLALYSTKDFMGKEMLTIALYAANEDGETFLTVSFGDFIGMKNASFVDTNNVPFITELLSLGYAEDTGLSKRSGFCEYPLYLFDEDFLKSCGKETYETYERTYYDYMNGRR